MIKNTPANLQKIEQILKDLNYVIRYEKGNFQAGHCIVKNKKVIIVNKFYTTEARIAAFLELITEVDINKENLKAEDLPFLETLLEEAAKKKLA